MTTVTIGSNFIEISGHSEDAIVCHGISAISQMVSNYVERHKWGRVEIDDGYLKICDVAERYCGDPIFSALTEALKDIETEYPGNIEILRSR